MTSLYTRTIAQSIFIYKIYNRRRCHAMLSAILILHLTRFNKEARQLKEAKKWRSFPQARETVLDGTF